MPIVHQNLTHLASTAACDVDTANFIFVFEEPNSLILVPSHHQIRLKKGQNLTLALKRTLCTTIAKKNWSRKQGPVPEELPAAPFALLVTVNPFPAQQPAALPEQQQVILPRTKQPCPYKQPSKLTLPSKIAFPVDNDDKQFLNNFSFLPVSNVK